MEKLCNMVDNVEYAKIVSHHFSDYVLEVMANSSRE